MTDRFILPLRSKIAAGLATAILVLIVGAMAYWALERANHASEEVAHTSEVLLEQRKLLSGLADAETAARGFTVTGDSSFLSPFEAARLSVPASIARLRDLTTDHPSQGKRLDTLESVANEQIRLNEQIIRFRARNGFDLASDMIKTEQGRIVMDHARALVAAMEEEEDKVLAVRAARQARNQQLASLVILIGGGLAFGLSLLVNRSIHTDVVERERQREMIERQARQLTKQTRDLSSSNEHLHAASVATLEEKARAEKALLLARESEERKAAVLRSALDSIIAMDADGNVIEFNPAAEETFGYTHDEAMGRRLADLIVPERFREAHVAGLKRYLETGEAHVIGKRLELPAMRKDGSEFESELTITRSDWGGAPAFTGVLRDITSRKKAEAEREQLIKALARSNQELDQFAYVASHDLKAPLRGIANLSQWIEEDLGERLGGENKAQMDLLRGRVHRMEALIDGILQYSRAGRPKARPEAIDTGAMVKDVMELMAPPRNLKVSIKPGMPTVRSEKIPLQQVFMNLLGNAMKHTSREAPEVSVSWAEDGAFFEFTVGDNGPGIAPQFHERIFGIFQTLEARDKVEGTGIGLSVVKKIVEAKGGRVWVESDVGQGARFKFLWPAEEISGA
jgi:PAS domain S-box-containing protein